ncbi:hypothetical protein COU36_01420, partial [Candidatus Micrarchaeota archaeon CG10_big_fil_rev_8_21_14_0_10_59_7]
MSFHGGIRMNLGRLLLYLIATSTLAAAAATGIEQMPKGITVNAGQTLDLSGRTIQTPSVTVNGGTLILNGTTLIMDGTTDGGANIWVKAGGTMNILSSSEIKSANSYNYTFWVDAGATFEMRDSKISQCGYGAVEKNKGLYVQADNAIIENNVFGENHYCLFLKGMRNAKVLGNEFDGCSMRALTATQSTTAEISSNIFGINKNQEALLTSVSLISTLDSLVSGNVFLNERGIELSLTNATTLSNNSFSEGPESLSIGTSGDTCPSCSVDNILEDNQINGKLSIYGMRNTVRGGTVKAELNLATRANSNKFDGVKFENSDMVLNSQTTSG